MLWQLDVDHELGGFTELMFLIHHVEIQTSDFVTSQTEILFKDYDSDHLVSSKKLLGKRDNDFKRRILLLSCALFT